MDFSPDGRFIVYDNSAGGNSEQRDVFVLTADGQSETRLVEHPATDLFPLWSHDGSAVVFASDRGGTMGAWAVPVAEGKAAGEPRLLEGKMGRFLPMGLTRDGGYYYGLRAGATEVYSGRMNPATAKLKGIPQRASGRFPGTNSSPAWSSDGNRLSYFSSRGSENYGQQQRVITIRDVITGQEHDLTPKLAHLERLDWSPDGRVLLVGGSDRRNRGGLYTVGAESSATKLVVHDPATGFRGLEGRWSADGKAIYYVKHTGASSSQIRELRVDDGLDRLVLGTNRETRQGQKRQGEERQGENKQGRISHLSPSRDGSRLAFIRGNPGEGDAVLYSLQMEERKLQRFVTANAVQSINWGPKDQRLLIGISTTYGPALWNIPVEGGAANKIKLPGAWNADLHIHPDGEQLTFTVGRSQTEVWVIDNLLGKPAGKAL